MWQHEMRNKVQRRNAAVCMCDAYHILMCDSRLLCCLCVVVMHVCAGAVLPGGGGKVTGVLPVQMGGRASTHHGEQGAWRMALGAWGATHPTRPSHTRNPSPTQPLTHATLHARNPHATQLTTHATPTQPSPPHPNATLTPSPRRPLTPPSPSSLAGCVHVPQARPGAHVWVRVQAQGGARPGAPPLLLGPRAARCAALSRRTPGARCCTTGQSGLCARSKGWALPGAVWVVGGGMRRAQKRCVGGRVRGMGAGPTATTPPSMRQRFQRFQRPWLHSWFHSWLRSWFARVGALMRGDTSSPSRERGRSWLVSGAQHYLSLCGCLKKNVQKRC